MMTTHAIRLVFQAALAAIFILAMPAISLAQQQQFRLILNSGEFENPENVSDFIATWKVQQATGEDEKTFRIIQFHEIPASQQRTELAAMGIILHDYLPNMAYYATIMPGAQIANLIQYKVRGVYEILPEYKLSFHLLTGNIPQHAIRNNNRVEIFLHFLPSVDAVEIHQQLEAMNISASQKEMAGNMIVAEAAIDQLHQLAALPAIFYIESVNPPPVPDNHIGRTLHRANMISSDFLAGPQFDGSGVHVMLQDDGIIGPHIDYQGRVPFQNIAYNQGDHGDHIAGTIMGAGNLDPIGRGMASGAYLHVYGAIGYQGFNSIAAHYTSRQIRITSTSYSDGCNTGYTSLARAMDQQSRLYRKLIHVFSAGNDGSSNCGYGAGAGWGNITGGHKQGKNVISVGSVNRNDALDAFSSRGPAHDGRVKPIVVAMGSNVYSTTNPNNYSFSSGTSMSCPGVSGTLAQLYHAYRQLNSQKEPDGGLMKMILMNTAEDLGNHGPDFRFGYGRIDASRALMVIEENRYDSAMIEQGQIVTRQITVPEGLHQLRIMTYWTDFEGTAGTLRALVNNMNMEVTDPADSLFRPWVLSHLPPAANLMAPAIRAVDSLNNAEQVTINNPVAGTYQITIRGHHVPQGPQLVYLTWEFIQPGITITYPFGGEPFAPAEVETLRWRAVGTTQPFALDYTLDEGVTWHPIVPSIPATMRFFDWTIPYTISNNVQVRVSSGDFEAINQVPFNIMPIPQNLTIDWACANSFRLSWDEVFGAEYYIVRRLGAKYMDSINVTPIPSYIFNNTGMGESWVTVQAVGADGALSRRAFAIRRQSGAFNCFIADLRVEEVPSLDWKLYQLSAGSITLPVDIRIRNIMGNATSDFTVGYRVGSGEIISEPVATTIQPDSTMVVRLSVPINLTEPGDYTVRAWVNHPQDGHRANDTLFTYLRVIDGSLIVPTHYVQTFDNFTRCMAHPTCEAYICDMMEGWTNLTNQQQDQIDWRTFGGSTPTSNTGPTTDHTTGTNVGNYLFLEPGTNCFDREAVLITPVFDLRQRADILIRFWYHMFGVHIGRLHVDALIGDSIIYDVITPLVGDQGDEWREATITNIPDTIVTFRFRGITGPGQTSDIAIDDFEIDMGTRVPEVADATPQIAVFPNPGEGVFNLRINAPNVGKMRLIVTDLLGKVVHTEDILSGPATLTKTLDISHLHDGIYNLSITSGTHQMNKKLVKR